MKKIFALASISLILFAVLAVYGTSTTGFFSKAFSKTVTPNQIIEQNITIKKYFNLTIRFRTSPSGSDLTFDDNDTLMILKDVNGNEIVRAVGVTNGKAYLKVDKLNIDSIATVIVSNMNSYEDVDQAANISFYSTKAYLTVLVAKKSGNATIRGYTIDDLTGDGLSEIAIGAFDGGSDVNTTNPIVQTMTATNGSYSIVLPADADGTSYDIYVRDYPVSS